MNSTPFILNKAWIDKLLTISLRQTVILIFSVGIPVLNTYIWCTYIVPWLSSLAHLLAWLAAHSPVWIPALVCKCQGITVYTSSLYNVNAFSAHGLDMVSTKLGHCVPPFIGSDVLDGTSMWKPIVKVGEKRLKKVSFLVFTVLNLQINFMGQLPWWATEIITGVSARP